MRRLLGWVNFNDRLTLVLLFLEEEVAIMDGTGLDKRGKVSLLLMEV